MSPGVPTGTPSAAAPSDGAAALPLEGGCLCGAVRYRLSGPLHSIDYCHCRMCQRASGAPAVAWATGAVEGFAWRAGTPRVYASSPAGRRWFCGACGSPLAFEELGDATSGRRASIGITIATLDQPARLAPRQHAWVESRIPWHLADPALPAHPDEGPDSGA